MLGILLAAVSAFSYQESFKTVSELVHRPHQFERVVGATVQMDGCTGTFISNKGHLLTALHCFEGAYPEAMEKAPSAKVSGRWEYGFVTKEVFGPGRMVRPGVMKDFWANDFIYQDVEVVAAGARIPLNRLDDVAEDFVILKLPVSEPTQCLPIFWDKPMSGDLIWALGYPDGFTTRDGVEFTDGDTLRVSSGSVNYTVAQSLGVAVDFVKGRSNQNGQDFVKDTLEYQKNIYTASVDVDSGMSGGPVVDKDGQITGVVSLSTSRLTGDKRELAFTTIKGITRALESMLSEEELSEIFDCH